MGDLIQFPYNKSFAYSTVVLLSILFFIFLFRTFQFNDPRQVQVILFFDIFFFLLIGFVLLKYVIPAARGKIALELNENNIIDSVRHRVVNWENVQDVTYTKLWGTFTAGIVVHLIDKNSFLAEQNTFQKLLGRISGLSYKTPFVIPSQYLSGDSRQIFQTIKTYCERRKSA